MIMWREEGRRTPEGAGVRLVSSLSCSKLAIAHAAALLHASESSTAVSFREHAVALQVDNLLGLRERKCNRIVPAVMGIGAHESMGFHSFGGILLDDPGGLVDAVGAIRGGTDAIAFVLGCRHSRLACFAFSHPGGQPRPYRFELREH